MVICVRQRIYHVAVFSEIVLFFVLCNSTVFNCLSETIADTCHAVRTVVTPDRLFVLQLDVVQWTQPYTFAASNALVGGVKIFCKKLKFSPDRIKGNGNDGFKQENVSGF